MVMSPRPLSVSFRSAVDNRMKALADERDPGLAGAAMVWSVMNDGWIIGRPAYDCLPAHAPDRVRRWATALGLTRERPHNVYSGIVDGYDVLLEETVSRQSQGVPGMLGKPASAHQAAAGSDGEGRFTGDLSPARLLGAGPVR
jgi:hypothetical protein